MCKDFKDEVLVEQRNTECFDHCYESMLCCGYRDTRQATFFVNYLTMGAQLLKSVSHIANADDFIYTLSECVLCLITR